MSALDQPAISPAKRRSAATLVVLSLPLSLLVGILLEAPYLFLVGTPATAALLGQAWLGQRERAIVLALVTVGVAAVALFIGALTVFAGAPVGFTAEVVAPIAAVAVYLIGGVVAVFAPRAWPVAAGLAVTTFWIVTWVAIEMGATIEP